MDAKAGLVTFARKGIVAVAEKVDRESRLSGVEALWKVGRNNINGSRHDRRAKGGIVNEGKAAVDVGLTKACDDGVVYEVISVKQAVTFSCLLALPRRVGARPVLSTKAYDRHHTNQIVKIIMLKI